MPKLSNVNLLGGGDSASGMQPSAPVAPPTGGPAAGSIDPIDIAAAKYGWGPQQIANMKAMRGSPPPTAMPMHNAIAQVDPYQNLANKATGGSYK